MHPVRGWNKGSWGCTWSDIPLCVVDCIPKPWRVHNGEPQPHSLLFYIHRMLSNLHGLHDALWKRGKLRQRQGPWSCPAPPQKSTPASFTAQTASLSTPRRLKACSLGTSKKHISQHRKCRWLLALAPASSLLQAFFLDSWNRLGVRNSYKDRDSGPCPASAPKSFYPPPTHTQPKTRLPWLALINCLCRPG